MKVVVTVAICGSGNAWKVAEPTDPPNQIQSREVTLEIKGNTTDGYHLVMTPVGCFTADYWYQTVTEAKESAKDIFGVAPNKWS